jgi:hypothetical protein
MSRTAGRALGAQAGDSGGEASALEGDPAGFDFLAPAAALSAEAVKSSSPKKAHGNRCEAHGSALKPLPSAPKPLASALTFPARSTPQIRAYNVNGNEERF